jgi:hypothetical protein
MSLNMPHEIQFDPRPSLHRGARQPRDPASIAPPASSQRWWDGPGGFSGDGGPANRAELRHAQRGDRCAPEALLICDTVNHRLRQVDLRPAASRPSGHRRRGQRPTARGLRCTAGRFCSSRSTRRCIRAPRGQRDIQDRHDRRGAASRGWHDNPATPATDQARDAALGGPKGLAWASGRLFVADTENHAIRCIDLDTGVIRNGARHRPKRRWSRAGSRVRCRAAQRARRPGHATETARHTAFVVAGVA